MASGFGPVNCGDQYPPAGTSGSQGSAGEPILTALPDCVRVNMWVSGASVYYQLLDNDRGWLPERYVPSSQYLNTFLSLDRRFSGIQFRNAVAGNVANVVAECLEDWELP